MSNQTYQLIIKALAGDKKSGCELAVILSRVFEREAGYSVWRKKGNREDVKDKVNEIFADLYDKNARALRRYKPDGGATPEHYFKIFARLRLMNYDRAERDRYLEALCEPATLVPLCVQDDVEESYLSQFEDDKKLQEIRGALKETDYLLFVDQYILGFPTPTLCKVLGINADALYKRLERIKKALQKAGLLPKEYLDKKAPQS